MPLVLDFQGTKDLYQLCADNNLTMARIGYTTQDQIHGIIKGASKFAKDHNISRLPLGIFATVGHYIMQQLPRYLESGHHLPSEGGDPGAYRKRCILNLKLATDFMSTVSDPDWSDYGDVHITHHYDHGHHTLPGGIISKNEFLRDEQALSFFSSVMFDDSHSPFADNIVHSAEYKKFLQSKGIDKVVEGCLEEVAAGGKGLEASQFTKATEIEEFLEKTGFELVVPNIGTESINAKPVGVQFDILEDIQKLGVGARLVVHGFSSIKSLPIDDQRRLGSLGVVGMNAWSYIPQEVGRECLHRGHQLIEHHDEEKGFPVDFDSDGKPVYNPSKDANIFFGPLTDQVRDLQVRRIAESVYKILDNLDYARLGDK